MWRAGIAAEESRGGAHDMIATGALDGADGISGIHVWPEIPSGTISTKVRRDLQGCRGR